MDLCREKHVKSNFCLTFDHYFVLNFCSVVVHCKVIVQFVSHHHCNFLPARKRRPLDYCTVTGFV